MKTYIITLFFIISIYQLNSQNLIWDYTVANNGTTSTLTVRAKKLILELKMYYHSIMDFIINQLKLRFLEYLQEEQILSFLQVF